MLNPKIITRWLKTLNYPSYFIFFVTAKCNANCKMCFYEDNMLRQRGADNELTVAEYEKISKGIRHINILGISGGEPFMRDDLSDIIEVLYENCSPLVIDLPTNGFFTSKIVQQVKAIARNCRHTTIDLQLSIDGPEEIHNDIRGLNNGFQRVKETYNALVDLKKHYGNIRLKACIVYSHYNQDYIKALYRILDADFKNLDRIVLSVVHGSVNNPEAFNFDWNRYFGLCNELKSNVSVKSIQDFHSIFTIALRNVKNEYLKEVLKYGDVYKKCGAGKKVVVINETGKVFPCEPLWVPVGDLRKNSYHLDAILKSQEMIAFNKEIVSERCSCNWNIPLISNLLYRPAYYPKILSEMGKIMGRSFLKKDTKREICT